MSDDLRNPTVIEYHAPDEGNAVPNVDPLAGLALFLGSLSMVTACCPDCGGMHRWLQMEVGIWGGGVGLAVAAIALILLLPTATARASSVASAAVALGFAAIALFAGLHH